jgi:hypothetical protein
MDGAFAIRKEMRDIIDIILEYNLYRLRPLLDALVETDPDDLLSDEEEKLLEQCRNDRKERPETFTSWREIREEKAIIAAGEKDFAEYPETFTRIQDI